jgi:hypothetical protein
VPRTVPGGGQQGLSRPRSLSHRVPLHADGTVQGLGQEVGVRHARAMTRRVHVLDEGTGLVKAPAQDRQHRVARGRHDRSSSISGQLDLALVGLQRSFGLVDMGQLHQGHESPEQPLPLHRIIARSPCQLDDFGRGGESILRGIRIPQRVKPGTQHLGDGQLIT